MIGFVLIGGVVPMLLIAPAVLPDPGEERELVNRLTAGERAT
jgi:hypothetical protein